MKNLVNVYRTSMLLSWASHVCTEGKDVGERVFTVTLLTLLSHQPMVPRLHSSKRRSQFS
jgi:hypothetical protein